MDDTQLRLELKALIVKELNLQGRDPRSIDDDAPLFGPSAPVGQGAGQGGAGLGLDSLDALQLAMSIEERFGVKIPEGDEARAIFASVSALADAIVAGSRAGA